MYVKAVELRVLMVSIHKALTTQGAAAALSKPYQGVPGSETVASDWRARVHENVQGLVGGRK